MSRQLLTGTLAVAAAVASLVVFRVSRGFPWLFAVIVAVAIGVLVAGICAAYFRLTAIWSGTARRDRRP